MRCLSGRDRWCPATLRARRGSAAWPFGASLRSETQGGARIPATLNRNQSLRARSRPPGQPGDSPTAECRTITWRTFPQPVRPAAAAPLRAVLLDAVFRRGKRQPVQVRLHGDGDLPAAGVSWLPPAMAGLVIGALFILPFLLFSATSGQLADKYDKTHADPLREEPGDRHHGAGGLGFSAPTCRCCWRAPS